MSSTTPTAPPVEALLAPVGLSVFVTDHYGRTAVHLPGNESNRSGVFSWSELNRVLQLQNHWTPELLKLVREGEIVASGYYCDPFEHLTGRRLIADPAKTAVFLSMGATLIANEIQWVAPDVQALCAALATTFSADVAANAYCSFGGVQGFDTHFDLHDVIALQTEGEKVWRIYDQRAEAPVAYPAGPPEEVREWFKRTRGRIANEVRMRPGDVLYLPRGVYHEARAVSDSSLHVSFSIVPPRGERVLELVNDLLASRLEVRRYIRDTDQDALEAAIRDRLVLMANALGELANDPRVIARCVKALRRPAPPGAPFALPRTDPIRLFRRTGLAPQISRAGALTAVRSQSGGFETALPETVLAWIFNRPGFALEELRAHFPREDAGACQQLVDDLARIGVLAPTSL